VQAICYRITAKLVKRNQVIKSKLKLKLKLTLIRALASLTLANCSSGAGLSLAALSALVTAQPVTAQPSIAQAPDAAAVDLNELLSKSLTAYGGEENVAQLASGFNVFGKEYDNVSQGLAAGLDLGQVESRPSDSSFRLMRKGVRWRLDHEHGDALNNGAAVASLTEGFNGEVPWVHAGARSSTKAEDLQVESAKLLNLETTLPATFVMEGLRLAQTNAVDQVVYKGQSNLRGTPVWNVQFNSPTGTDSFTLAIEQNNYMVVAVTFELGEGAKKKVSLEYSQYQPSAGSLYPHRFVRRVDEKVELVRITSDLSANGKIKDSEFDRPGGTFHLSRTITVPFDYGQREILVKGRLNNGEELDFLFDTGASDTIIDRRVAAENYLLKEGVAGMQALSGSVMTNTSTIGRLELGNLIVNDIDARILDLSSQSRHLGRRLGGIIGTNVISKFVVAVDYGKTTLSFYDADSFSPPSDCAAVTFSRRSAPVVKVKLNGREDVMMLVDTGAAFNNLPPAVAARYSTGENKHVTEGTGLDGRPVKLGRVIVDNVVLAGKTVKRVDFTYTLSTPSNAGASGKNEPKSDSGFFQTANLGILGNPFLENFFVYFDYKFQRMLIRTSAVVKTRSIIDQAIAAGDDQLVQKRDFRLAELSYNKALLSATSSGDKKNEARLLGRFGNLRRMMAKDLGRPEHSKASYDYFVRAQDLAKKVGSTEIEGRILADWSLLYLDGNQAVSAKQTIDRALQLTPQDANVNIDYAVHLFRARRFPEMQRYVEKALFLDHSNWQALWYQVKLSEMFGDSPKVISTLKEILRHYPWSKTAQDKLKQFLPPPVAPGGPVTPATGATPPPSL
jgi:predicted aspartyl protease